MTRLREALGAISGLVWAWIGEDRLLGVALGLAALMTLVATTAALSSVLMGFVAALGVVLLLALMNAVTTIAVESASAKAAWVRRLSLAISGVAAAILASVASLPVAWALLQESSLGEALDPRSETELMVASFVFLLLIVMLVSPVLVAMLASPAHQRLHRSPVSEADLRLLTALTWVFHCGVGLAASGAV